MDITNEIKKLKEKPGFKDHVGMILTHNGVVRNWSRKDRSAVQQLQVTPDYEIIEEIRQKFMQSEGIFDIIIEARSGTFETGDDLLFIIVAGDLREHIKPVMSDLLDEIKSRAVTKKEIL
ncbi:MAG: molybdenum cofactor biosynthesis protein [Deltaproteobacteria bacterium]|nr:MAG: molybdenum cofactor biosynthesis protein [Deltaproteobacteria bacterium]